MKRNLLSSLCTLVVFVLLSCCLTGKAHAYVEALAANIDTNLGHFQPMVAILCGHGKFHNQYLDENKKWISDPDSRATCTKDKLEILEYCRKVYPKKDIRNIVESSKYYRIDSWCKVGQNKCKSKHYVKPFRCLEGVFQSDALLVPEHCVFDHIHNQSVCQTSQYWNRTAISSCSVRNMKLQSYAMLLPCGVGIFSGVEFVCCPHSSPHLAHAANKNSEYWKKVSAQSEDLGSTLSDSTTNNNSNNKVRNNSDNSDSEEDNGTDANNNDDDYYDDDYEEEEEESKPRLSTTSTTTSTTTTTTESPVKFYLSHFNSQKEHDAFKDAQKALEDDHKFKVTKVMKEWSELEEHYQEMRIKDPKSADEFKKRMTNRFQKTVEALEEEGSAEKRQIISMHQQRVMSIINMRKKSAMDCYTQSLEHTPPKTKKIEKCLEKLLRALEKDRMHTLHHFKHLLNSFTKQALKDKEAMLDHLTDLIKMANKSLQMLDGVPSVADKIKLRMIAYWHNLRGVPIEQTITRESELAIMDRYEEEVAQRQLERERQKEADELKRQELKELEEEQRRVEASQKKAEQDTDSESTEDEKSPADEGDSNGVPSQPQTAQSVITSTPSSTPSIDEFLSQEDPESNEIRHAVAPNQPLYIQSQSFHHSEPSYSIKHYHPKLKWNGSVYITLAFAGIALLTATIVGVVLLRKHTQSSPHNQGFIEVNQTITPEERHVANMQINGYENPTYKFFEVQTE